MSLCDKNVPPILKGKFYKVDVRPAMLYGAERIKNEDIQDKVEVASMVNKMRDMTLIRWACKEELHGFPV